VSGLEHVRVSEKNPALVIFVVDVSKSMKDSGNIDHIFATIPDLKTIALSKPNQIHFAVIGFDSKAALVFNHPLEEAPEKFMIEESIDQRTNLKAAAKLAEEVYHGHVSKLCTKSNPLASILFFTDGFHSPGIDYDDRGIHGLQPNLWHARTVDEFLNLGKNVICGLIDYDSNSPIGNFPKEMARSKNKLTAVTRLEENLVSKAYARDISHTPELGQDLTTVFGPKENLYEKLFVVGVESVEKSPASTSAFVRLGTYSSTRSSGENEQNAKDDTDFHNIL